MRVNIKGLINRLDSLRERINDLFDNLDSLEELDQEDIEIETVEEYFRNDDTFNLSIALGVLEQADKLDETLEIIKEKDVNVHNFKEIIIKQDWTYEQYIDEENDSNTSGHQFAYKLLTEEEYDILKGVLLCG